jgi:hypothetical protein
MEELVQNKINVLKVEIFDIIREQEPLVAKREQLTNTVNAQINDINNVINKLESLKVPKVQALIELEKTEKKPIIV